VDLQFRKETAATLLPSERSCFHWATRRVFCQIFFLVQVDTCCVLLPNIAPNVQMKGEKKTATSLYDLGNEAAVLAPKDRYKYWQLQGLVAYLIQGQITKSTTSDLEVLRQWVLLPLPSRSCTS